MANYADGVTDLHLPSYVEEFKESGKVAGFLAVPPPGSYHTVEIDESGQVTDTHQISKAGFWINGGYFVLRPAIFDYMEKGEELVEQPFERLIAANQLFAHRHTGFWAPMDTFKDKQRLDQLHATGDAPWQVWNGTGRA